MKFLFIVAAVIFSTHSFADNRTEDLSKILTEARNCPPTKDLREIFLTLAKPGT